MNRKTTFLQAGVFFFSAFLLCLAIINAQAREKQAVTSIKQVRKVYVQRLSADPVFSSRLKNEMRQMGLQFVGKKSSADAILTGSGDYDSGEFYGQIKFFNRNGKLIWQAKATRPRGSNYMAYSRLADQLRRALKN